MSKIGRVIQEIMEKHGGKIPNGYTLTDYLREKENEKSIKGDQNKETSKGEDQRSNRNQES